MEMINRFSELIAQGVAPSPYKHPTFNETGDIDKLSRLYNNVWGALTDSHMTYDACCGIYRITGSICTYQDKFDLFISSPQWGASVFKQATGYVTLGDLFKSCGLTGYYTVFNGDHVYELKKAEK